MVTTNQPMLFDFKYFLIPTTQYFSVQAGSKDLILRKWKTLTDYITVECDGKDITPKLRELKVTNSMYSCVLRCGSGNSVRRIWIFLM